MNDSITSAEWRQWRAVVERTIRQALEVDVDALVSRGELVPRRGRWYQVKTPKTLDAINPLITAVEITRWDDASKPTEWVVKLGQQERWDKLARTWAVSLR
jgi:hypothetical protein